MKRKVSIKECGRKIRDLTSVLRGLSDEEFRGLKATITRDELLGSLRRILASYKIISSANSPESCLEASDLEYLGDKVGDYLENVLPESWDLRQVGSLGFFQNARAFRDIVQHLFPDIYERNRILLAAIKTIRDLYCHSHDKEFLGQKTVAQLKPGNDSYGVELFNLEIFDYDSGGKINSVRYSIDLIIFDIFEVVSEIVNRLLLKSGNSKV